MDLMILGFLGALTAIAFFWDHRALRIAVVVVLAVVIIWQDVSVDAYYRSMMEHRHSAGLWNEQYKDGAAAILAYCKTTRIYGQVATLFLLILFLRGFK